MSLLKWGDLRKYKSAGLERLSLRKRMFQSSTNEAEDYPKTNNFWNSSSNLGVQTTLPTNFTVFATSEKHINTWKISENDRTSVTDFCFNCSWTVWESSNSRFKLSISSIFVHNWRHTFEDNMYTCTTLHQILAETIAIHTYMQSHVENIRTKGSLYKLRLTTPWTVHALKVFMSVLHILFSFYCAKIELYWSPLQFEIYKLNMWSYVISCTFDKLHYTNRTCTKQNNMQFCSPHTMHFYRSIEMKFKTMIQANEKQKVKE
jgi:hypothetical protein